MKILFSTMLLLSIFACDDIDIYKENNSAPEIMIRGYGSNDDFKTSITDSFRVSGSYIIECQITDEVATEHLSFDYSFSIGSGEFEFFEGDLLYFKPKYNGLNVFSIKVTDVYGAESLVNASIFAFDNLAPVAKLSITQTDNSYIFDASGSYDSDKEYGGHIVSYKLTINGNQPIYREDPVIEFQGLYIENPTVVKLSVQDNNSEWSEEVNEIIYP